MMAFLELAREIQMDRAWRQTFGWWMKSALVSVVLTGCAAVQRQSGQAASGGASSRPYAIVNAHEHIQSLQEADKFLKAMDAAGIAHTLLVGSSKQTIFSRGGFVAYDENNAQVLTIQGFHPGRFSAFCTINPRDPDKLRKLEGYLRAGAKGLKLYSGHSHFYDLSLTDPEMDPVYAYVEQHQIPVLFHVNLGKFFGEFETIMARHPRLRVILPHLGLSSIKIERIASVLDRNPTVSTDFSLGYDPYLIAGLKRISRNPEKYRQFIQRYQDRVLFGTDIVVTNHPRKTTEWLTEVFRCYRGMLETQRYRCGLVGDEELNGLALDPAVLRRIYEVNPRRILGVGPRR